MIEGSGFVAEIEKSGNLIAGGLNFIWISRSGRPHSASKPVLTGYFGCWGILALAYCLWSKEFWDGKAINQMHAIPRNILRMMLRLRSHFRQLTRIQLRTRFRMQMHHANGQ